MKNIFKIPINYKIKKYNKIFIPKVGETVENVPKNPIFILRRYIKNNEKDKIQNFLQETKLNNVKVDQKFYFMLLSYYRKINDQEAFEKTKLKMSDKGLKIDIEIYNLLEETIKNGSEEKVLELFEEMKKNHIETINTYHILLRYFTKNKKKFKEIFKEFKQKNNVLNQLICKNLIEYKMEHNKSTTIKSFLKSIKGSKVDCKFCNELQKK
jgi:uncharacterized membrane protein YvbJ